jgi:hypothetical protein
MSIQDQLHSLYERFLTKTDEQCSEMARESIGPFLIRSNDEYESSFPRVVIVGRETNGWLGTCSEFKQAQTIETAQAHYEKMLCCLDNRSPWFQYMDVFRREIDEHVRRQLLGQPITLSTRP